MTETRPASAEVALEYHRWYDDVHLPEILSIPGFVSARRLQACEGESFLAVYEVDDVEQARAALAEARDAGRLTPATTLADDPPTVVRWFESLSERERSSDVRTR